MSWDDEFNAVVKAAANPTPTETAQPSVDLSDFEDGAAQYDFTAADFTPDQPEAPEHDANYLAPPFDLGGIDLLSPPGFAGDITAWIDSRCRYPRRRLAVASALVTLGNIGGLSHEDSRDGVTANMLAFCVAASACHAKGTGILMFDGTVKAVENVCIGDLLMGPDSKPRHVNALFRGQDEMFKISPKRGEAFVINRNHILNLEPQGGGDWINISVNDYLSAGKNFKAIHKLHRAPVEFERKVLNISPYVMGVMLGDGVVKGKVGITSMDHEIHDAVRSEFDRFGLKMNRSQPVGNKAWQVCYTIGKEGCGKGRTNPIMDLFASYGLAGCGAAEKFIPHEYKTGSRDQRLELMAGIIDTDGSLSCGGYDFISKSRQLADDVVYVARSLGLHATAKMSVKSSQTGYTDNYWRVFISGDCSVIPVRLARKMPIPRKMNKSVLRTGFDIESIGEGEYFGFNVDCDNLYLTSDFMVHHNTGKEAVQQAMADLHRAAGLHYAMQGGIKSEQEITRNLIEHQAAFYVIDEIGIFLQKVKNAQKRGSAAYLEGVFGMIMSVYSKANSRYLLNGDLKRDLRKVYAAAVAKAEDEGEDNEHAARMLKMVDEGLERPFLSLVGYTTPSTFDTVIDGESATQGFIGRAIMIQEKGINPEARAKVNKAEVPRGIAARLTQLFHGGSYDMSAGYGGRIEHNGERIRVETTQEASDMLLQVISWLHRYADERGEDTGEAAVAISRRAYEMIAKISFILAIPTRERTAEHVRWAFAYVRQELDAKIALVFANDNSKGVNALSATAARIIGYIDSDQGTSASVIANRMKMARDEVEKVLAQMEGGGMVYRETSKRKYKGKAVEVWKVKEQ